MNERAKSATSYSDKSALHLKLPTTTSEGQSVMPQTTQAFETSSTGPLPCTEDGKHVVSRMQLSDKKRKEKERFREKEREKMKKEIQRNRSSEAKVNV